MTQRPHDLVVLGATGVSGRLLAEQLQARAPKELRWALAARRPEALRAMRDRLGGPAIEQVDIDDEDSLARVVGRTRVLVNVVGPYLERGERVVRACVDAGTHYCDLAGELPFMRRSIDAFHELAKAAGVKVVHACGYDSVPSDLGMLYVQEALAARGFPRASSITTYVGALRGAMSGGSAASLLVQGELPEAEVARATAPRGLDPDAIVGHPAEADSSGPTWDPVLESWVTPFFMVPINTRVVRRSLALLGDPWSAEAYRESMVGGPGFGGRLRAIAYHRGMRALLWLTRRRWGRRLLEAMLPRRGSGPSRKTIDAGGFRHLVVPTLPDGTHRVFARIEGEHDPGYGETSRMLAVCALALAEASGGPAGVLTPALTFGTRIIPALRDAGMTWTVEEWPTEGAPTP